MKRSCSNEKSPQDKLIVEYPNHPRCDTITDSEGNIVSGLVISDQAYNHYSKVWAEFEEDESIEPYINDCGVIIPYGTLRVYGTPLEDSFDYCI